MTMDRRAHSTENKTEAVDLFQIGATMHCITCHGQKIEGEVMAYDYGLKLLALKKTEGGRCSIVMVNLAYVKELTQLKAPSAISSHMVIPSPKMNELDEKIKKEIRKKSHTISSANVTLEARKMFSAINRTYDNIKWEQTDIVVMERVVIRSPYNADTVSLLDDRDTRSHQLRDRIKMMVERHLEKQSAETSHSHQTRSVSPQESVKQADEFLEFSAKIQPPPSTQDNTKEDMQKSTDNIAVDK